MSNTPVFKTISELEAATAKTGDELVEVVQGGNSRKMSVAELTKVDRYDLAAVAATSECDLATSQVFAIDNTVAGAKTLSFVNAPEGRALTAVVKITGNTGSVNWPGNIAWNQGTAPEMGATSTTVILFWDGASFVGNQGATV